MGGRVMARIRRDSDMEERDAEEMDEEDMNEADLEEDDEMEEACPGCGIERSEWKGNNGQGVPKNGETYCCQDCADGIDCTCAA
jgi:hypothetical protein